MFIFKCEQFLVGVLGTLVELSYESFVIWYRGRGLYRYWWLVWILVYFFGELYRWLGQCLFLRFRGQCRVVFIGRLINVVQIGGVGKFVQWWREKGLVSIGFMGVVFWQRFCYVMWLGVDLLWLVEQWLFFSFQNL